MYSCILFDMDGTLVNSFEGIYHAYETAFKETGTPFPGASFVRRAIGAPLPLAFSQLAGLDKDKIPKAVACYRRYYREKGMREAYVYEGMKETLQKLKERGCFLGTATLKKEEFARKMLDDLGLLSCFDAVCGADATDSVTKAGLILRAVKLARVKKEDTILAGDTPYDAQGAREAGVDFLAVTYGFGYGKEEKGKIPGAVGTAGNAAEILDIILRTGV